MVDWTARVYKWFNIISLYIIILPFTGVKGVLQRSVLASCELLKKHNID